MKFYKWFFIIAVAFIILIFIGYARYPFLLLREIPNPSLENFGIFGDSFGALTSLFSALTILGLIHTINLQTKDLTISREELALTRKELKEQKDEMKLQNDTLLIQKFENTLFNMIDLFIKCRDEINIENSKGAMAIEKIYRIYLHDELRNRTRRNINIKDDIFPYYNNLYNKFSGVLDPYFSMLRNVIKFIDASIFIDKSLYINLIKDLLSSYEMALLFYYCINKNKLEIRHFIIKYKIFEHLDKYVIYQEHREYLNEFE